ncbi:MAG: glycosyltransferase family 39 protein [Chloroflexi bacterium]|nr:glycosyltransferase family 39 protein [Chloroflexota bacterium]MCI0577304.1 glycosyltransferase family 39 protein [Chloroflexota bacterium]MCI0647748.1 glycosyltransferase family 39 protein [Chloroflexota bacterium]MCI0731612.1 glycosyltransferase family 39 protein [Chloroflexota bacterium]
MSTEAEIESPGETAVEPLPPAALRLPVSALWLGGALLVVMGQAIYSQLPPPFRQWVYLLMGLGLVAFALGGSLVARQRLPVWLLRPGRFLLGYFQLSAGQLVLLGLAPCFALMAWLAAGEGLLALNLPVSLAAWLLAIGLALAGSYKREEAAPEPVPRWEWFLLLGLFLGALLLRAWSIGSLPATLSGDEGSAGLMAVRFLKGEANNIFTIGWFSFPSLYFAVQSLGIVVLGQTTEGLRLASAVAGALTVVGLYWLARLLFDRVTAVFAAVFLMVLHYHVHFSRIGLNNIWDGFFAVMILASLWYGWKTGRRPGFLFCGLALGLAQYFYVTIRVFPLLLLIWTGIAFLQDRAAFKHRLPDLILAAFVALVVFLPLGLFFARHPAEFNAPMQRVTIFEGWLEATMQQTGKPAVTIVLNQIKDSFLGITHLPLRHWYNPGVPLLLAIPGGLFLLGLLWALLNLDLRYVLVLLPLAATVLLGGLSQDAPASQRYVMATPAVAILVATPLAQLAAWLQQFWPRYQKAILVLAAVVMAGVAGRDLYYYFFEVYDSYVLGGLNTEVATSVAHYLQEQDPPPTVYFFGFPRMGYYSFSTIPYLAPEVEGVDVNEPLAGPPGWSLQGPTIFIFLPERAAELDHVRAAYPGGRSQNISQENGPLLYITYKWP